MISYCMFLFVSLQSGADYSLPKGPQSYPIGTITVQAFDVAVITIDFNYIQYNMTYGTDFRIGKHSKG